MAKQQQQGGKKGGQQQQQQGGGKKGNQQGGKRGNQQQQEQPDQGNEKKFQAIVIGEAFSNAFEAVSSAPILMPIGTTAVRMIDYTLELLCSSNVLDVTIMCGQETADRVTAYLRESARWRSFLHTGDDVIDYDKHDKQEKLTQLEIKVHKTSAANVGDVIRDVHDNGIINTRNFLLVN